VAARSQCSQTFPLPTDGERLSLDTAEDRPLLKRSRGGISLNVSSGLWGRERAALPVYGRSSTILTERRPSTTTAVSEAPTRASEAPKRKRDRAPGESSLYNSAAPLCAAFLDDDDDDLEARFFFEAAADPRDDDATPSSLSA